MSGEKVGVMQSFFTKIWVFLDYFNPGTVSGTNLQK